jgi:hypothetical protein
MRIFAILSYRATPSTGEPTHGRAADPLYDGAGYERMMAVWSRLVGKIFLDRLAPRSGVNAVKGRVPG